ncbi:hypothetical protein CBS101457_000413 [Exobasidium rhododendri]|nr:hypothetical protein CBS101457_000413 [Exobasidium rhododendri]
MATDHTPPVPVLSHKTIVIKLGTSSILSETTHQPKLSILSSLVETCHALRVKGHKVVLVCSGAIGMGKVRMGMMNQDAPSKGSLGVGERQALAALGQLRLIALWDSLFGQLGISVAQVLLTRNDIADRPRYLNARTTLQTLLSPKFNAIPIVNENDTVSVSELRFGDNDTLSAITAGLIDADFLFLLTDVDGLYTGNPRSDPLARRLGVVDNVTRVRRLVNVSSLGSQFGTGGMMTKLIAAELATAAGVATVIINGTRPENIIKVVEGGIPTLSPKESADQDNLGSSISSLIVEEEKDTIGWPALDEPPHTIFLPLLNPLKPGKWSILHALHPAGTIIIDQGAFDRIARPESGGRLLPAGVIGVDGTWERMQAVRVVARRKRTTHEEGDQVALSSSVNTSASSKKLHAYLQRTFNSTPLSSKPSSGAATPPLSVSNLIDAPTTTKSSTLLDLAQTDPLTDTHSAPEEEWELVEVGRGLANYNSIESERIKGIKSSKIATVLGYADSDYIVDQLALHSSPSELLRF